MYLKSIEMHGFKSFAGKLQLTFDDGITGIVGPNGSGKSNVSDAVRWVLGEQSAKTLRGASMQDVIFSGTESRKALSFAYVCITLDNSDHVLPLDFDEVSVSRRIYSSGESEYQINKANCRLKDIQELFYDTGIGKEGYSIIGQGQIERILSSKPEDRREIFDEAVGIVKYKKRKEASLKRLQEEEDNLARIEDVLSEITERIEPLKAQAEVAREYLSVKERQKALDINLFLVESDSTKAEEERLRQAKENLTEQLAGLNREHSENNEKFGAFSREFKALEESIEEMNRAEREASEKKGALGNDILILEERINAANALISSEADRGDTVQADLERRRGELSEYTAKLEKDEANLKDVESRVGTARDYSQGLSDKIKTLSTRVEELNKELLSLMDEKIAIAAERQKQELGLEQINIQKAGLNQRQLEMGTQREQLEKEKNAVLAEHDEKLAAHELLQKKDNELKERRRDLESRIDTKRDEIQNLERQLAFLRAKRETIKNIAERYEGYGGAVRHVMQKKDSLPGVVGVVADLFTAKEAHETAIETALGGAIQNIVTEDEDCARACVDFLKANRHGRATFLPLTAVKKTEEFRFPEALSEPGVVGLASDLIDCDDRYRDVCEYLLGRIVVARDMDAALGLARRYKYRLNIVTLEGEQLRPGGSITGGAFKQNSNLLGRGRELTELLDEIKSIEEDVSEKEKKLEEYRTAMDLVGDDMAENSSLLEASGLSINTLAITLKGVSDKLTELENTREQIREEKAALESQAVNLAVRQEETGLILTNSESKQAAIEEEIADLSAQIDENTYMEGTASRNLSEVQIDEANAKSEVTHDRENIERLINEVKALENEIASSKDRKVTLTAEIEANNARIAQIKEEIKTGDESYSQLTLRIEEANAKKEEMRGQNKKFLDRRDELTSLINNLGKEEIRLDTGLERLLEDKKRFSDRIWEEYQLTYHNALEYRVEDLTDTALMRKELSDIANRIRSMGNVNVGAIEEYSQVSERYEFLTGQCEDLREGREKLLAIIEDLNFEMKERFEKGFAEISKEFDIVFKELFGGGYGKLSLSDDHDILESGISIVAQPPGKKLTNMMQMSGGEKSLVAICVLFSILNLKPSPFCLLDEIEAALDEPNVDRFAKYLDKLTKHTQFIIITHRRGTMNAADRLYGITMQEKGISTLVSVSLIEDELE